MKQITKERLIKAKRKITKYYDLSPENKMMNIFSKIGWNALFSTENNIQDISRYKLELTYLGFFDWVEKDDVTSFCPTDVEFQLAYQKIKLKAKRLLNKRFDREGLLHKIQRKYNISDLREITVNFGREPMTFRAPADELKLIDSDIEAIYADRDKIVDYFLDAIQLHDLNVCQYRHELEYWEEADLDIVEFLASKCNWAHIYEVCAQNGDRLEISLDLGVGYPECYSDDSFNFIASGKYATSK